MRAFASRFYWACIVIGLELYLPLGSVLTWIVCFHGRCVFFFRIFNLLDNVGIEGIGSWVGGLLDVLNVFSSKPYVACSSVYPFNFHCVLHQSSGLSFVGLLV